MTTQSGEEAFKEYVSALESNQSELEYLSNKIYALVSEAEASTGRDMGARNFNMSFDVKDLPTGRYGVITYQFKWIGFATTEDKRIMAGDAFAGGLYLSKDDALIITYPSGYKVDAVSPEPDIVRANELIWYGLRDFSPGEPSVVLRSTFPVVWVVVSVIGVVAIIIAGGITYKKKQEKKIIEAVILKTDEDKILEVLKDAGGVLYQSDIIEKTGFSKSKTSALLNSLKENGRIEKVMKGRKNLIRLK
ncbi:MAG: helix-turn-helix domain-containing protein [archaeon]|nr:helix-turn-helix domain-containing protein [archaeon]